MARVDVATSNFLRTQIHLYFSVFWFPSFLGIVSRWNKKRIHYKQSKQQKQNPLGLLQIPHMQINVVLRSSGIGVGITSSSLTSLLTKQYCFSNMFLPKSSLTFKINSHGLSSSEVECLLLIPAFVQFWLNCISVAMPTILGWNQEIGYITCTTKTKR